MPSRPSYGAAASRHDAATSAAGVEELDELAEAPPSAAARALGRPRTPKQARPPIVVKSDDEATTAPALPGGVVPLDYPVQLSKVQPPPLRDDTLARDRLLDWLSVKIHSRVVLLVAEAGYGKTTLLADFSRRTRVRMLWFRLDRGDRDWVGFIAHLVAALRVHTPAFGSTTAGLLRESGTSVPSIDTVLNALLRELSGLPNDPLALVFDDLHIVDDSPEIDRIIRELLARGPDRMSFVFASRREPQIRLARLRALGEVAELETNDLRFDPSETERLFRESYDLPLESSVLAELNRRTEGWAASLQLVRAAIHDRNPSQVRTFVTSLSGAEGHLYEYLAEEVIGDLPEDLQQFLMRTSILETVDLSLAPIAAGVSEADARAMIDGAERRGLLGRGGGASGRAARAHPLVREFLISRLSRADGGPHIAEIHQAVARKAEASDWQLAARHYHASGQDGEARRVIAESLESILAGGAYAAAQEVAASLVPAGLEGPVALVVASRIAQQRGAVEQALELAERAQAMDRNSQAALLNLVGARLVAGDVVGALENAREVEVLGGPLLGRLGEATVAIMRSSLDGPLDVAERRIDELDASFRNAGATHYLGVSFLNRSVLALARGDFTAALDLATESIAHLDASSAGVELVSAHVAHASALAFLGEMTTARMEMSQALERAPVGQAGEVGAEVAEVEALVGETQFGWPIVNALIGGATDPVRRGDHIRFARALLRMREGDLALAAEDVAQFEYGKPTDVVAFEAKKFLADGLLNALRGVRGVSPPAAKGTRLATAQGAEFWAKYGELLVVLSNPSADPSRVVARTIEELPAVASSLAELIVVRLGDLDPDARSAVAAEAESRPWRWRPAVRKALATSAQRDAALLAGLLEVIGEVEDIDRLREADRLAGRRINARSGVRLARRLADRVFIEDLGRVQILLGTRLVEGADIRRRVLALLCFLLSRPNFSSTRDEVIDSLWPEHDPAAALNSLNQTVYFLRRVFEPSFREEVSPGYVGQDGETIWLDSDLIDCRSRRCMEIIRGMPRDPTPEGSIELANAYRGRFALDFAYEEWSTSYRDALHAAYLRVVERAVRLDLDTGHFDRGTFVAERAAEIDPDSEEIQAALVRLYRHSGAYAAAAEQYAHYANVLRDLGVEPPAFADV